MGLMVIRAKYRNGMPSRVGHGDTGIGCDGVVRVAMLLVGRAAVWEHRARGVICLSFDLRCVSLKPQWAGFIKNRDGVWNSRSYLFGDGGRCRSGAKRATVLPIMMTRSLGVFARPA
ncbi:hypothetical protein [Xylella fastidiosa]|uniref:Uncharacterized protein n=3 Tax=Xylella fastidiosa TaxID=2371 RepID=Q9PFT2_XYLFA|nr:hypothetical protein [Xylella fastidiosa]AAF83385.1 hypothetical protein XF_0575 [Xylella fastidiosa 9a5c]MDG5823651.1 hypothetical protein [Xylella fastidiosa subsp. pauca]